LQKRDFPQIQTESVTQSLKDALQFIFKTKIIFWAMFLDLSSVFFGGIIALLPIFAQDILHVGADGFGLLRAAPAFGALAVTILGINDAPKISIIVIGTLFQQILIIANTTRMVDRGLIETGFSVYWCPA
jgi:hypothetical protein